MSCPDCFRGSIHEGTTQGKITKLHGLDAYIAEPAAGKEVKGFLVYIPDAFGWKFGNNRLLCDNLAAKSSYKVIMPDFMNGYAAPLSVFDGMMAITDANTSIFTKIYHGFSVASGIIPFLFVNRPGASYPRVVKFFTALRENEAKALPIGATGYCWGGKHVVLLAQGEKGPDGKPLLDAGFTAHPSMLSIPSDIEKIVRPVSFALAETDQQISPEQAIRLKSIVEAKEGDALGEVEIIKDTGHGFAVRADMKYQDIAKQAAAAEDMCIHWLNKHFGVSN